MLDGIKKYNVIKKIPGLWLTSRRLETALKESCAAQCKVRLTPYGFVDMNSSQVIEGTERTAGLILSRGQLGGVGFDLELEETMDAADIRDQIRGAVRLQKAGNMQKVAGRDLQEMQNVELPFSRTEAQADFFYNLPLHSQAIFIFGYGAIPAALLFFMYMGRAINSEDPRGNVLAVLAIGESASILQSICWSRVQKTRIKENIEIMTQRMLYKLIRWREQKGLSGELSDEDKKICEKINELAGEKLVFPTDKNSKRLFEMWVGEGVSPERLNNYCRERKLPGMLEIIKLASCLNICTQDLEDIGAGIYSLFYDKYYYGPAD